MHVPSVWKLMLYALQLCIHVHVHLLFYYFIYVFVDWFVLSSQQTGDWSIFTVAVVGIFAFVLQ